MFRVNFTPKGHHEEACAWGIGTAMNNEAHTLDGYHGLKPIGSHMVIPLIFTWNFTNIIRSLKFRTISFGRNIRLVYSIFL